MRVRFWGTRGSIPTPGPDTVQYGGNTSCVEVTTPAGADLILDAGSGIRVLGLDMAKRRKEDVNAVLLLSHVHWDHIQGFPFFTPNYFASTRLDIYGLPVCHKKIDRLLSSQMEQIYFPVDLGSLTAQIRFHDLGERVEARDAEVRTIHANHTTDTEGFRIEAGGHSVVFIPDNELSKCEEPGRVPYRDFVDFCAGADLLIHDSQYTDLIYPNHRGWGHSTIEQTVRLALDAGVKQLALFHHDPLTTDRELDERIARVCADIKGRGAKLHCFGAREGIDIDLAKPQRDEA